MFFDKLANGSALRLHPNQKPLGLLEYLIRAYSNPGDTVLDNAMGSGAVGIACANTGRNFVGIEREAGYFDRAEEWNLRPSAS